MTVEGDVAVLGDADAQDIRGVGRELPGHLVAHAAAQVVLVREQADVDGFETGPELDRPPAGD